MSAEDPMRPDDLLARLGAGAPAGVTDVVDGEAIVREGDAGDWLYLVLDGEVVVEKQGEVDGSAPDVLDIIGPGGVFGELSFIDGRARSATVRARGPVRVLAVSRAEFDRAAAERPQQAVELMGMLLGVLSARVRASSRAMMDLFETGRRLARATGPDDVAAVILERATRAAPGATGGIVALTGPGGLRPIVGFGLPVGLPSPLPIDTASALVGELTRRPDGLCIGPGSSWASEVACFGKRWSLVTPLLRDGRLLGLAALFSDQDADPFATTDRVAMAIVASHAAARL